MHDVCVRHHEFVYVDDFIGCKGHYLAAMKAFDTLLALCAELSIALAPDKCLPLAIRVVWLGLYLSFIEMTISISPAKLDEVFAEYYRWMSCAT